MSVYQQNNSGAEPNGSGNGHHGREGAEPPAQTPDAERSPDTVSPEKQGSIRTLGLLNFFVSDVQTGMGPYMSLFLRQSMGWSGAQIGSATSAGWIVSLLLQTPIGAAIDRTTRKRELIVVGCVLVMIACLATVLFTHYPVVTGGQMLIGVAGAILPPCIAAVALGLVGRKRMDAQQGRNQSFNAAGNVAAAVLTALIGYKFGLHWMFYVLAGFCVGAILCALRIRPQDIDNELARGSDATAATSGNSTVVSNGAGQNGSKAGNGGEAGSSGVNNSHQASDAGVNNGYRQAYGTQTSQADVHKPHESLLQTTINEFRGFLNVLKDRNVLIFALSAVLFSLANSNMSSLIAQLLSDIHKETGTVDPRNAALNIGAFMIATQFIYMLVAPQAGRLAATWGRKPLMLVAFSVVALRGVLYTLRDATPLLHAHRIPYIILVQAIDGIAIGIASVVIVLIVADLTKGTGRFNVTQGAIFTAQGLGATISSGGGGWLKDHSGYNNTFLTFSGIAAVGAILFGLLMPETRSLAHTDALPPATVE